MTVKMYALAAVATAWMSSLAVAGPYTDNGKTFTHDCAKTHTLRVSGNDNTITTTGTCIALELSGNHNKVTMPAVNQTGIRGNDNVVTVDATDSILVTGKNNTVTYRKTLSRPDLNISNVGENNKVTKGN